MSEPKELLYGGASYDDPMPKVRYEDIPEERRAELRGRHSFRGDESPEWFEEWLAVYLERFYPLKGSAKRRRKIEEERRDMAGYHRAEFNHICDFKRWRVDNLDPLVKRLASMAEHDPQYDWQFLYSLERQKILCMGTYLSHSRMADENGNYGGKFWLDICLYLLKHIEEDGTDIPYESIGKMNIRNVQGLVSQHEIDDYLNAPESSADNDTTLDKQFYGRIIYVRKMERLYHLIRLYKTRDWWE